MPPREEARPGQGTEAGHEQGASLSLILSTELESHPAFVRLGILAGPRSGLVNEVLGFMIRCLCREAASRKSTLITRATAEAFAHERTDLLLDLATDAGLLEVWHLAEHGGRVWALNPEDSPLEWQQERGSSCLG